MANLRVLIAAIAVMAAPLLIFFLVKRITRNKNLTIEETVFEPWYLKSKKETGPRPQIQVELKSSATTRKETRVESGVLHEVEKPRDLFMPKPVVKDGLFYCPKDATLLISDAGLDVPSARPLIISTYLIWKCPKCGWTYIHPSK